MFFGHDSSLAVIFVTEKQRGNDYDQADAFRVRRSTELDRRTLKASAKEKRVKGFDWGSCTVTVNLRPSLVPQNKPLEPTLI